jgi:hypothetical protein
MPTDSVGNLLPPVKDTLIPGDPRLRMRSMTAETLPQAVGVYVWENVKGGSFIYHSGTNLGKQVHMGLYGKAKFSDPVTGMAYPGITHDWEFDLFYSEIDPALHDPGNLAPPAFSDPNNYKPKYFLINGQVFDPLDDPMLGGAPGINSLIRIYSTASNDIVPTLMGADWKLIAEDGSLYPYPKTQYTALLSPLKTKDILFSPDTVGIYPVYDRKLNLTNHLDSNGGYFAKLDVPPTLNVYVRLNNGASFYNSISAAYLAAAGGDAIDARARNFMETLLFNQPIQIVLNGGFDQNWNPDFGFTTVNQLILQSGSAVVSNLIIQ